MVTPSSSSTIGSPTTTTRLFAAKKESATDKVNGDGSPNGAGESREDRYKKALEEAKSMKVGVLKKALTDKGISTKSFFEKTEFVKAYAEANADNKTGSAKAGRAGQRARPQEEPTDPSYRDVVMQKIDRRQLMGTMVIDTSAR
jgi:hypothetical protein